MQVTLQNVGVIKSATLQLNSLTVLSGDNGTGKSTALRSLFSLFSGLNQYRKHQSYLQASLATVMRFNLVKMMC